ncbi:Molybdenum cofactor synthesis protein 3 [Mitosporidium daphniae]
MQNSLINDFGLTKTEIERYGRQIILQDFEITGQACLKKASVLVVGAGGIGSPLALSLVCSGIGKIGLVDDDFVEATNLHRQTLHTESRVGQSKVYSAATALREHQSDCIIEPIEAWLDVENVSSLIEGYDVVCDASDNIPTRYLLNDACKRAKKHLVSASAIGWEGQIITFLWSEEDSNAPCYRCLFPTPPSSEFVVKCNDGGVLGPITSVIGHLQALEVINLLRGSPNYCQKMLFFDGKKGLSRCIQLRNKRVDCLGCSIPFAPLVELPLQSCEIPLENVGFKELSVSALAVGVTGPLLLLDVRPSHHFKIGYLRSAVNIPSNVILRMRSIDELFINIEKVLSNLKDTPPLHSICVMCRRGIDSIHVSNHILRLSDKVSVYNLKGGLLAWSREIDPNFPIY